MTSLLKAVAKSHLFSDCVCIYRCLIVESLLARLPTILDSILISDPMAYRWLGVSGVLVSEDRAIDSLKAMLNKRPEPD